MAQREREHRRQPRRPRPRPELRKPLLGTQIRHQDRLAGLIGRQTRTFAHTRLQLLKAQRRRVRCGDVPRLAVRRDQRHPRTGHRHDLHDPLHQAIKDSLDRKVGHHRLSELGQHPRQLLRLHLMNPALRDLASDGKGDQRAPAVAVLRQGIQHPTSKSTESTRAAPGIHFYAILRGDQTTGQYARRKSPLTGSFRQTLHRAHACPVQINADDTSDRIGP